MSSTSEGGFAVEAEHRVFGGRLVRFVHDSDACGCAMRASVYLPPQAEAGPVPAMYWLSGLTCTDENFMTKAGAQRYAADSGLALVAPDTSPRGLGLPGEDDDWDFGTGAGFYVNATEAPWSSHYRMHDYVVHELPALIERRFPVRDDVRSVSGHSMGGHGALVVALRNPGRYRAVSAFAPICAPSRCPWGRKAFSAYLGADEAAWRQWDASALIGEATERLPLLVDQGEADEFLAEQLRPDDLAAACDRAGHPLELRRHAGYDHSYYFIASFIGDHLAHHAAFLR